MKFSTGWKIGTILILGFILRVVNLNQSLWLDEAISINVARNLTVQGLLTQFSPGDFHPPLYYLLLKVWIFIFGPSEISARTLSVLFGVATIWVVFRIGQVLFDKRMGLVSALFLATAPLHIYYSQEARMYVPATFFSVLVVWFFVKVIKSGRSKEWIGLIITGTLLIYTDYLPGFLLLSLALYLIVFEPAHLKKHAQSWLFAVVSITLFFAPWIPTLFRQFQSGLGVQSSSPEWWKALGTTDLRQLLLVPVKFTIGRISFFDKNLYVAFTGLPLALFGILFTRSLLIWRKTALLWFWLAAPVISIAIVGFYVSVFSYFRLLFVLPAFYLLLAVGALAFRNRKAQALAVFVVMGINLAATGIYLLSPRFHREDWRSAVSWIESHPEENAVTLFVGEGQQEPYKYYSKTAPSFGPAGLEKGPFDTIWLMRYVQPILDPQDTLRQRVEENGYRKLGEYDFNGVVVWEYQK